MRGLFIIVPLVVVGLGALYWSQQRSTAYFISGLIEADDIRLGSRVGGRVQAVDAVEGQATESGQVLIQLEPYDLRERLAQAKAVLAARESRLVLLESGYRPEELDEARARRERFRSALDRVVAGPRPLEISVLEGRLAMAQAQLSDAQREFDRVRPLFEKGDAAQDELDRAKYARDLRQAAHNVARDELALAREGSRAEDIAEARATLAEETAALALLESGYRTEEIAAARAEVAAARAEVGAIAQQIAELTIRAPRAAVVDAIDLQPGDLVAANAPMITLVDPDSLYVRAYVPENRLDVRLGQTVWLRVDAFPGRRFCGTISFVARQGEFMPANVQTPEERVKQVFRIKIAIQEGRGLLRAGMAADVLFDAPAVGSAAPE